MCSISLKKFSRKTMSGCIKNEDILVNCQQERYFMSAVFSENPDRFAVTIRKAERVRY